MSKRYKWINGETYCDSDQMYDNETGNKTQPVYVADLLNEQDQKIKELEKAFELACEPRDDWGGEKYSGTEYDNYYDYFMAEAKEMLDNE